MTLLAPGMLWWLALLVPLAALYLLKVRPRRQHTTAWFLWDLALEERRSSVLLRRLRDALSLLLMALVVVAVVLALARPSFSTGEQRDLILLVDNSASMSANTASGHSRLDEARRTAAKILRGLDMTHRASVASVADGVRFRVHLSDNRRELLEGLEDITPTDLPMSTDAVRELLASGGAEPEGAEEAAKRPRVILLTDGCFADHHTLGDVELIRIGEPAANIGIVTFDLFPLPVASNGANDTADTHRLGLYFHLASSHDTPVDVDVLLCRNSRDDVIKVCPVTVGPGLGQPELFTVTGGGPGRYVLALDVDDALPEDNRAFAVVPRRRPVRIAVRSGVETFFLARCVEAFGSDLADMQLTRNRAEVVLSCGQDISDGEEAPAEIIFRPSGTSPFWTSLGEADASADVTRVVLSEHPAVRYCDLSNVTFSGARRIEPPPGAVVIATNARGVPLLYRCSAGDRSAYVVNLDPVASEFFLSAWFPVLVHSMVNDLTGRPLVGRTCLPPGTRMAVNAAGRAAAWTLTAPDGSVRKGQSTMTAPLSQRGFYRLHADAGAAAGSAARQQRSLGVGGSPPAEVLLNNDGLADSAGALRRGSTPGQWLLIAAVLLACVEAGLYHRRKLG
ncbi:MAG: VWA domain-containing protein [Phycisphaerae bacterium]|nr:VWA domain-containing protein [Phycisphaerae bacterium]